LAWKKIWSPILSFLNIWITVYNISPKNRQFIGPVPRFTNLNSFRVHILIKFTVTLPFPLKVGCFKMLSKESHIGLLHHEYGNSRPMPYGIFLQDPSKCFLILQIRLTNMESKKGDIATPDRYYPHLTEYPNLRTSIVVTNPIIWFKIIPGSSVVIPTCSAVSRNNDSVLILDFNLLIRKAYILQR